MLSTKVAKLCKYDDEVANMYDQNKANSMLEGALVLWAAVG